MYSKRPITINNSLVHGICNYNCITCHINKKNYTGPREYQRLNVVKVLIERIHEAANAGVFIRYLALSGDGEPTLHPQFEVVMNSFGQMLDSWSNKKIKSPKIAMVTNGLNLDSDKIGILIRNKIGIKLSFPTSVKKNYEQITQPKNLRGTEFDQVQSNISELLKQSKEADYNDIEFHITPPHNVVVRQDFEKTLDTLSRLFRKYKRKKLCIVMFPAISNRAGQVEGIKKNIDFYHDLFKKYNRKYINGVRLYMTRSTRKFYKNIFEVINVYQTFNYPCLWNANFMIASNGSSVCVNDQSISQPTGTIVSQSIVELLEMKMNFVKAKMCKGCNQAPEKLRTNIFIKLLGIIGFVFKSRF